MFFYKHFFIVLFASVFIPSYNQLDLGHNQIGTRTDTGRSKYPGISLYTCRYHCIPAGIIVYLQVSLYTCRYHCIPAGIIVYLQVSLYTCRYHCIPAGIIVYLQVSLYTAVHSPASLVLPKVSAPKRELTTSLTAIQIKILVLSVLLLGINTCREQ